MLKILKENLAFKKQILKLSKSELIKTYKGAALGPLWAVVKPSITIFVYWFAFALGFRGNGTVHGFPFFTFMLVGIIPWFFMSEAILSGAMCIRQNRHFVTKMPFPVSTIMTYTTLSKLYIHFGLCVIMYVILLFSGIQPSIYNLQFFIYMPLMYIFFTCLAWITAPLSAISRDFENVVKSIPVSYTHLDVYKRQVVHPVGLSPKVWKLLFPNHLWVWAGQHDAIPVFQFHPIPRI